MRVRKRPCRTNASSTIYKLVPDPSIAYPNTCFEITGYRFFIRFGLFSHPSIEQDGKAAEAAQRFGEHMDLL